MKPLKNVIRFWLLNKEKSGSPFDGERTSERYITRCYYAEEQD